MASTTRRGRWSEITSPCGNAPQKQHKDHTHRSEARPSFCTSCELLPCLMVTFFLPMFTWVASTSRYDSGTFWAKLVRKKQQTTKHLNIKQEEQPAISSFSERSFCTETWKCQMKLTCTCSSFWAILTSFFTEKYHRLTTQDPPTSLLSSPRSLGRRFYSALHSPAPPVRIQIKT